MTNINKIGALLHLPWRDSRSTPDSQTMYSQNLPSDLLRFIVACSGLATLGSGLLAFVMASAATLDSAR